VLREPEVAEHTGYTVAGVVADDDVIGVRDTFDDAVGWGIVPL
jgi:hypothetical protein